MAEQVDNFLEHYGVKGMKWGKRGSGRGGHSEKRGEYKARIRSERQAYEQAHLSRVITTSMKKGEDVLVKTQLPNDYAVTVMTGKQFVEMAGRGQLLNARTTDVFATLDKKLGQFVLNENPDPGYTPSERR